MGVFGLPHGVAAGFQEDAALEGNVEVPGVVWFGLRGQLESFLPSSVDEACPNSVQILGGGDEDLIIWQEGCRGHHGVRTYRREIMWDATLENMPPLYLDLWAVTLVLLNSDVTPSSFSLLWSPAQEGSPGWIGCRSSRGLDCSRLLRPCHARAPCPHWLLDWAVTKLACSIL